MSDKFNVSKIKICNSIKIYFCIYLFISLFMTINMFSYQTEYIGTKFNLNWIIYSLNQTTTSSIVIPIVFIMMINYLTVDINENYMIILKLKSRINLFKTNIMLILLNSFIFILFDTSILALMSLSITHINFSWSKDSINSFRYYFDGSFPFIEPAMTQILFQVILLSLFLIFWGIITQLINNYFKNKTTSTLITVFLLFFQTKVYSMPYLPKIFKQILPGNNYLIYSNGVKNIDFQNSIGVLFFDYLIYWFVLISIVTYLLKLTYNKKQFF